jgi:hypothetical protein
MQKKVQSYIKSPVENLAFSIIYPSETPLTPGKARFWTQEIA